MFKDTTCADADAWMRKLVAQADLRELAAQADLRKLAAQADLRKLVAQADLRKFGLPSAQHRGRRFNSCSAQTWGRRSLELRRMIDMNLSVDAPSSCTD